MYKAFIFGFSFLSCAATAAAKYITKKNQRSFLHIANGKTEQLNEPKQWATVQPNLARQDVLKI